MNALRVLLIENDPTESERIMDCLEKASHAVLSTTDLLEATQALSIQQFDAVVLPAKIVNDGLREFRETLQEFEKGSRAPVHIPVLCYASSTFPELCAADLSQFQVDACLPFNFEALAFSQLVARLASGLSSPANSAPSLPIFKAEEFQEQVGFDQDLVVEIIDLFLSDLDQQLTAMQEALQRTDLLALSRLAHSIKGSLGSLYAMQAASRAQVLEHVAKEGEKEDAAAALERLNADLQTLRPVLQALRNRVLGS